MTILSAQTITSRVRGTIFQSHLYNDPIQGLSVPGWRECSPTEKLVIRPFEEGAKQALGMSYGLSSCGYDIRVGKIDRTETTPYPERTEEQLRIGMLHDADEWAREKHKLQRLAKEYDLKPGEFLLCSSLEYMELPDDLAGKVHDKSTLARSGLALQNTILEPGWRGYITLELSNHSSNVIPIRVGQPIAQVVFELLDQATILPYVGKYQDQEDRPVQAILTPDDA